jgi:hypothetical protein
MNKKLLDQIAKIISPYLKTKHKDNQANQIAQEIINEIDAAEWRPQRREFEEIHIPNKDITKP